MLMILNYLFRAFGSLLGSLVHTLNQGKNGVVGLTAREYRGAAQVLPQDEGQK